MNKEAKFPTPRLDGDSAKKKAGRERDKMCACGVWEERGCFPILYTNQEKLSSEAISDQSPQTCEGVSCTLATGYSRH